MLQMLEATPSILVMDDPEEELEDLTVLARR